MILDYTLSQVEADKRMRDHSTILLVEDSAPLRHVLTRLLTRRGFVVLAGGSGQEGLSHFHAHQSAIRLALIDMMTPGMTGLDLGAELVRESPDLKILYISGFPGSIAAMSIQQATSHALLLKPFNAKTLINRVNEMLV
jgi:DNA-binding response OmpR family regulator